MSLPLELLQTDWFHAVASVNPVSYLLQAFRSLLIEGWNLGDLALGFAIAAAIGTIGMYAATRTLKTRLVRT
jgi:ABC-2 type transport system permease protein